MSDIIEVSLEPTYKRGDQLTYSKLNDLAQKLNGFLIGLDLDSNQTSIIIIEPAQFGGNHRHPRTEVFIALTEGLSLISRTTNGSLKETILKNPDSEGNLTAYIVPSGLAHAVKNTGNKSSILLEFADSPQVEIIPENII